MLPKTPPEGNVAKTGKRGHRVTRTVLWLLLIGVIVEIGFETSSRICYHKSLNALLEKVRTEEQAGRKLSSAEVAPLASGWPSMSEQDSATGKQIEYCWPSLFWDLRIQLRRDANGAVAAVTIGSGVVPSLTSSERPGALQPAGFPAQSVQRQLRGMSAGTSKAFALGQKGDGFSPDSSERGRLLCEIIRQALLMTARDEFALPTRDLVLGDVLPDEDNATLPQFIAVVSINGERRVKIDLEREFRDGTSNVVATHEFQLSLGRLIDALAARVEAMSAAEFVTTLEKAGLTARSHQYLPEGRVNAQITDNLNEFEILPEWGAVRSLHSEIHELGESPERLGELARGYARLAATSQFLWSPAYKAFAARALLYAERLIRKTEGSPFALWQRAYVRALVGLHTSALEDLAAAGAASDGAAVPDWTDAMEGFCRGDLARLSKAPGKPPRTPLRRFLKLLATGQSEIPTVRLESAILMLKSEPDCELAYDVALDKAALGVQRQMSGQAVEHFSEALREYLRSNDIVPDEVRKLADAPAGTPNSISDLRFARDGRRLLGAQRYGHICVWDVATGELLQELAGHPARTAAEFLSGGHGIISAGLDDTVRIWEIDSGRELWRGVFSLSGVHCVAVSADGKLAAWAGVSPRIVVWDLERQQQKFEIATSATCFYYLQFSPDGTALAAAGRQESICLYDARTGAETKRIEVVIPESL